MNQIELMTFDLLQELGFKTSLLGYKYIQTAVQKIYENPKLIHAVGRELYPAVAREHNTSGCRVERGIRYARETAYSPHPKPIDPGKIGNSEFLYLLTETVRKRIALEGVVEL